MTSAAHIRTGGLRHYAQLQTLVTTPDPGAGQESEWITERNIWCQIRPLSGGQKLESMRVQSTVSHEIYTRYAEDVAPGVVERKRILHDGTPYRIDAAWMPAELTEFVHLVATRGVAT